MRRRLYIGCVLLFALGALRGYAAVKLRSPKDVDVIQPMAQGAAERWQTVVMRPTNRSGVSIRTRDKFNPVWWVANADDPVPPADYFPDSKCRNVRWWVRNPFHDFVFYVIGLNDKETKRTGLYPDKVFKPDGGWNLAVTKYGRLRLPFVSCRGKKVEFYAGWRPHGNFGLKLRRAHWPDTAQVARAVTSAP